MVRKKIEKSAGDETGRIVRKAGPKSGEILTRLAWPFRRIWWAIEKFVVWPVASLLRRTKGLAARIGTEIAWPFRKTWWAIEKSIVWPISDRLRRGRGEREARPAPVRKYGPAAWVGGTALAMLAAGAVTAAVYFYNEAETSRGEATLADSPAATETVVVPMIPPAMTETSTDPTLQGAAPALPGTGKGSGSADESLPPEAVRPKPKPESPALRVAHDFAQSFVAYELGREKVSKSIRSTTTPKLARELDQRPPRLPASGKVPKATVLNVVEGKKKGDRLDVSVALMRTGSSSELRLGMRKVDGRGWLVSEVRG
jgi:hypothetical protein